MRKFDAEEDLLFKMGGGGVPADIQAEVSSHVAREVMLAAARGMVDVGQVGGCHVLYSQVRLSFRERIGVLFGKRLEVCGMIAVKGDIPTDDVLLASVSTRLARKRK